MTPQTERSYVSVDDRRARGEEAAKQTPLSAQAEGPPTAGRPDPVELLIEQNAMREPDLVPVRHGRMMVSPFTFYRGAAKVMAVDLAGTPTAGLRGPAVRGCAPVELRRVRARRSGSCCSV